MENCREEAEYFERVVTALKRCNAKVARSHVNNSLMGLPRAK